MSEPRSPPKPSELNDAKRARVPWTTVAVILRQAVGQDTGTSSEFRTRWIREAAGASGYTIGALKRFMAVFDFVSGIPAELRPDSEGLAASFTALEMIQRIESHDRQEAMRLLGELRTTKIPISRLRAALEAAKRRRLTRGAEAHQRRPVGISAGHSTFETSAAGERNLRANATLDLVYRLLPELTGKFEAFQQPLGTAPIGVRCDAIAWLDVKWARGDGFESVHAPGPVSRSVVSDRVTRAIVASRFFRRFYLVFTPESSGEHVHRAASALDQLEAKSVGVVWLGAELPIVRKRSGPPVPDWSDRLAAVCPGGKWKG